MIAKRITSKAATSRISRLVRYVVAAEGGLDPRSWQRTADYVLCSKTNHRGEKVGGVRVMNCGTDDPAAACTYIEAVQAANTKSKADKTYHLVFSFPPGEEPPLKVLHDIEDELVAAIGLSEHQRISAVHIDRDHLHVHVAINKVHPKGFQNIEPYYDKKKLMEACERLEIKHKLQRTNHGLEGEVSKKDRQKLKEKPAQAEAHSGIETLIGYIVRDVAPAMHGTNNWQELHRLLAIHGLQIKPRGAGLVIGNGEIWVKASQCDRAFSMKSLTDRLGPFEKSEMKPAKAYQPRPQQKHSSSAALFEQYQREKLANRIKREKGLEMLKHQSDLLEKQMHQWKIVQRLTIKTTAKGPKRTAALKMIRLHTAMARRHNWNTYTKKRLQLLAETKVYGWAEWLAQRAEAGDIEALEVLRSKQARGEMLGNILTSDDSNPSRFVVLHKLKHHIDKDGLVTYSTKDGGVVIDRKTHIQALRTTSASTMLALEIAAQKFSGQGLIVEGQDAFKAEVMRLAKIHAITVRVGPVVRAKSDKGIEL